MTNKEYISKKNKIAGLSLLSLVVGLGLLVAAIFADQPVAGILIVAGILFLAGLVYGSLKLTKLEEAYKKNPDIGKYEFDVVINAGSGASDFEKEVDQKAEAEFGIKVDPPKPEEETLEEVPPRKSRFDKYR